MVEGSPMARETGGRVILKKWFLIPPFLTLSIINYGSRVKWSNSEKG